MALRTRIIPFLLTPRGLRGRFVLATAFVWMFIAIAAAAVGYTLVPTPLGVAWTEPEWAAFLFFWWPIALVAKFGGPVMILAPIWWALLAWALTRTGVWGMPRLYLWIHGPPGPPNDGPRGLD